MAFNPFTSFRKYQKFWMATILLVCMLTFVLCTGVGGDFGDRILQLLGRGGGQAAAKLYGRNVYDRELRDLKLQRTIANDFMRKATEVVIINLENQLKDLPAAQKDADKQRFARIAGLKQDLETRLKTRPRYFEGTNKLDDLLEFMIWRHQADRLNVNLTRDNVIFLFNRAIHGHLVGFGKADSDRVEYEVRSKHYGATKEVIFRALADEFRVRIVQLALMKIRMDEFRGNLEPVLLIPEPYNQIQSFMSDVSFQMRNPVSPHQFWQYFVDKRSEFDVGLVPVPV